MKQLTIVSDRPKANCPICAGRHCVTTDGRLWTHGPRPRRCRGSRLRPTAARALRNATDQPRRTA